ncbi:MAG: cytochrome c, partial [Aureliella sp.]
YQRMGCKSCHSTVEGVRIVGPSFAKSYGQSLKTAKGEDIKFDQQYIRQSILEPQAQAREGYQNASQMPSFQGKLNEEQLSALTSFLEALKDDAFVQAVADGDLSDTDKESLGITDAATDAAAENPAEQPVEGPAGETAEKPAAERPPAPVPTT